MGINLALLCLGRASALQGLAKDGSRRLPFLWDAHPRGGAGGRKPCSPRQGAELLLSAWSSVGNGVGDDSNALDS